MNLIKEVRLSKDLNAGRALVPCANYFPLFLTSKKIRTGFEAPSQYSRGPYGLHIGGLLPLGEAGQEWQGMSSKIQLDSNIGSTAH